MKKKYNFLVFVSSIALCHQSCASRFSAILVLPSSLRMPYYVTIKTDSSSLNTRAFQKILSSACIDEVKVYTEFHDVTTMAGPRLSANVARPNYNSINGANASIQYDFKNRNSGTTLQRNPSTEKCINNMMLKRKRENYENKILHDKINSAMDEERGKHKLLKMLLLGGMR